MKTADFFRQISEYYFSNFDHQDLHEILGRQWV